MICSRLWLVIVVAVGFVVGLVLFFQLPAPPDVYLVVMLMCAAFALLFHCRRQFLCVTGGFVLFGFCYAAADFWLSSQQQIPAAYFGQDLLVTGRVVDLPERDLRRLRFVLDLETLQPLSQAAISQISAPGRVRLNWYGEPAFELRPGQRLELAVRLRAPHGFVNPGGFDYEKWLYRQRLIATGYVRDRDLQPRPIESTSALRERIESALPGLLGRWRMALQTKLHGATTGLPQDGQILALAIGDRSSIEQHQRELYFQTGTSHLLSISGLHIGIVAGVGALLAMALWRAVPTLQKLIGRGVFAAAAGLSFAALYAGLAGFALPTQRALIMLAVIVLATLSARHRRRLDSYALALLAVGLWEPRAVLGAGFWLSFGAVAVLFVLFSGVPRSERSGRQRFFTQIYRAVRAQWLINIGLAPLTLVLFSHVSIVSPLANLIAVPLVGLIVTPLVFAGTLLALLSTDAAGWLFIVADFLLDWLQRLLEWLVSFPFASYQAAAPSHFALLLALLAATLLLVPLPWRTRWLLLPLLLPLWYAPVARPLHGDFDLAVLDVGQGTAVVVLTRTSALVYDTGPRFSASFDAATAAILPYLRYRSVRSLDRLVISHPDNDHAGGARSLLHKVPVGEVYASTAMPDLQRRVQPCLDGQAWQRDGVQFRLLHPTADFEGSENDRSCVLLIESASGARALLSGDIEAAGEAELLRGSLSAVDWLLAPHHGSDSSSTAAFVDRTRPAMVVHSAGYRNRYGFPSPLVQQRYAYAEQYNTATDGALLFTFAADRKTVVQRWRAKTRSVWRQ